MFKMTTLSTGSLWCLLSWFHSTEAFSVPRVPALALQRPQDSHSTSRALMSNDSSDEIEYDDFDFVIGDNPNSNTSPLPSLQGRFQELQAREQELQQQISSNWKEGYWSVRGCSLDPNGEDDHSKVQISSIAVWDELDHIVLVGRTDGSLVVLQLGTEYLATFTNRLVAQETSNATIAVREELRRAQGEQPSGSSFEILSQHTVSLSEPIQNMVLLDHAQYLFVQSGSNGLVQFPVGEDGPLYDQGRPIPLPLQELVTVKAVQDKYLLTVSPTGDLSLLQPNGDMVASWSVPLEEPGEVLLSCDVDDDYAYFGTSYGRIWIYDWKDILGGNTMEPKKILPAFDRAGVSSICAAGPGTMGGSTTSTTAIVAGSTEGEIKQWELFPRGSDGLEYWPKIPSQKLPGKAHIVAQANAFGEADAAILTLKVVEEGILLSATHNQLTIWNGATGKVFADMQGLQFQTVSASCQLLTNHLLVTNGMEQYLCVHDFSMDPNLSVEDMIVPDDDY